MHWALLDLVLPAARAGNRTPNSTTTIATTTSSSTRVNALLPAGTLRTLLCLGKSISAFSDKIQPILAKLDIFNQPRFVSARIHQCIYPLLGRCERVLSKIFAGSEIFLGGKTKPPPSDSRARWHARWPARASFPPRPPR